MSVLNRSHFYDEKAAFAYVESILWPNGPVCPHCGGLERAYRLEGVRTKPNAEQREKGLPGHERHGLWKCGHCRKQFTVRKNTIFEESHCPLHKWLQAIHLMASSKKGISAHQMHRVLEVQYKTAWFLEHRIREAMRSGTLRPFGGGGGDVEADETFIGREPGKPKKRAYHHKMKVLSLVDRDSGQARSVVVDDLKPSTILPILYENIAQEARILTDEGGHYKTLGYDFAGHKIVRHGAGEYVSADDRSVHTNTIEGYFSIFKRGMKGVYQHCAKKHLHRYLAEFDFRYNHRIANGYNDSQRAQRVLASVVGKRLTYRDSLG
ncbi:MAG: IS1595 family transposase [Hyphomonadaceae bacterium]